MFRMRRLHLILSMGCYVVSVGAKFIENRVMGGRWHQLRILTILILL